MSGAGGKCCTGYESGKGKKGIEQRKEAWNETGTGKVQAECRSVPFWDRGEAARLLDLEVRGIILLLRRRREDEKSMCRRVDAGKRRRDRACALRLKPWL